MYLKIENYYNEEEEEEDITIPLLEEKLGG